MGRFHLLSLIEPIIPYLPHIPKPQYKRPLKKKIIATTVSLWIFLTLCQIPLYGIQKHNTQDPLQWMRKLMVSNRGTFMELGISPIITSGMIIQLLIGSKIINVDSEIPQDRENLKHFEKFLSIIMTIGESIAYIGSGMYGELSELGMGNSILILFQLFFTGILIIVIDEFIKHGYGIGSAISLFIATNVCETILWKSFSPVTINVGRGAEFEGVIIAILHNLLSKNDKLTAFREILYRENLPNVMNIICTLFLFVLIIYLEGFKIELPIKHRYKRGVANTYPIKLLYTSSMPIILYSSLVANVYFLSQSLYKKFPDNLVIRGMGQWSDGFPPEATGGIVYYLSPPGSFTDMYSDVFRAFTYILFISATCAAFSKSWIDVSGASVKDVANMFKKEDMTISGFRDSSIKKELNRYIPIAATCGGILMALLTVFADISGAIGSGSGILLTVTTLYSYYETILSEYKRKPLPMLSG